MRMIDADALLKIYKNWLPQLTAPEDKGDRQGVETCIAVLEDAPTVEAVILPCPLGTTLYRICEERNNRKPFIRVVTFNRNNFTRIVLDNEVGKTAFLTREEAEAALAEMMPSNN